MARELGRGIDPNGPPFLDPRGGYQDISSETPPDNWDDDVDMEGETFEQPPGAPSGPVGGGPADEEPAPPPEPVAEHHEEGGGAP